MRSNFDENQAETLNKVKDLYEAYKVYCAWYCV